MKNRINVTVSGNQLKDESSILENYSCKELPDNLEMNINGNNLSGKSSILFQNGLSQDEEEIKKQLSFEIIEVMNKFEIWTDEYKKLQEMKIEISNNKIGIRQFVQNFGMELTTGSLSGLLSSCAMELIGKYI
ncbi:MAG: hypothetical protein ACLTBR_00220 [Anaerostipes sp.]|uniref:hypothetical protein n=1 Tax=Anaerostipes sp. TaxID=1872530 RepID=UPI003992A6AC